VFAGAIVGAIAGPGCAQPTVDVVAVWIDDDVDESGRRSIQIYDHGQRRSIELEPKVASASTDLLRLQVAPGGIGFAASAVDTVFIDLRDGGRGHIDPLAPPVEAQLEAGFAFTRSGQGMYRDFADEDRTAIVFMSTAAEHRDPFVLELPQSTIPGLVLRLCASSPQACLRVRTASAASVVYAVELGPGIPAPVTGRIVAWGMPGDDVRGGSTWTEPTLLALGEFAGRAVDPEAVQPRIDDFWCIDRLCITPDGEAAIAMQTEYDAFTGLPRTCELLRWRWDGPREPNTPPSIETIPLSDECPRAKDPWIIAALSPDLIVLDDEDSIHLTDLATGAWVSTPKLGAGPPSLFSVDQGRAMVFVANNGAITRADETGVRIVNAEHTYCSQLDEPVVSPGGAWVVLTCLDDLGAVGDFVPAPEFGSIVRISSRAFRCGHWPWTTAAMRCSTASIATTTIASPAACSCSTPAVRSSASTSSSRRRGCSWAPATSAPRRRVDQRSTDSVMLASVSPAGSTTMS
jgi:hypothetical protein